MAMAVKSSLMYSGLGIQSPECWSTSTGWDQHENLTEAWEWEDPNANTNTNTHSSGRAQGETTHHHLRVHSNDWSDRSVVTIASPGGGAAALAGSSKSDEFSSGIPGVAATRGSDSSSPLVKNEPDEAVVGTPATRNESFFVSLGSSLSKDDGRVAGPERNDSSQNVTLKLGRRSYVEDSGKDSGRAPSLALSPPGKKQRPLSPTTNVPRCQVEGCKADLSGCKDYHKRHKVCEMHSKAPKAIAGGIEQRFCQQCSRFHLLKEFDEGKRSCRRRLAGHNERRRKPHPETHSLFGMGNPYLHREISTSAMGGAPFYFPDIKPSSILHTHRGSFLSDYGLHSYGHGLTRPSDPWSLKSRNDSIPTFQIQNPKTPMTTLKPSPGLNLGGHHNFLEGSLGPLGQGLSLSSSTPTGGLNISNNNQQDSHHSIGSCSQSLSQSVSGLMDSGRALSLLSSQSWAPPRPPQQAATNAQHPTSVSTGDLTLEQLVASSTESSNRVTGSRFSHHLGSSTNAQQQQFDKQLSSLQSGGVVESGGLNFGLTATGNGTHERGGLSNMLASLGGYANANDSSSILALVQGNQEPMSSLSVGFGSRNSHHHHQGACATMDLMETFPSAASHGGGGGLHHNNNNNNNNEVQQQHSQVSSSGLYSGFATF